jgi:hypothetical protein
MQWCGRKNTSVAERVKQSLFEPNGGAEHYQQIIIIRDIPCLSTGGTGLTDIRRIARTGYIIK